MIKTAFMLASAVFSGYSHADSFEGCYSRTDKITSAIPMLKDDGSESDERFKLKTSYINIFKKTIDILQRVLSGALTFIFALSQPVRRDNRTITFSTKG
ncbi:hypothetical protein [Pseudoalteromonas sp. C8]|uniref:hypothetical protein n=1 Tax=Pseudoalteromonas sp. C8 TaxID=2686345 RepID=UPI001F102C6F|nr:hypothetical protein [Pseudoalteromonas sp. C8]